MGVEPVLTSSGARRALRRLELEAYASVVSAFRAQGTLSGDKKNSLELLCKHLGISSERHRAEIRRAVNDELLSSIAGCITGVETDKVWRKEGQKLSSTNPRFVSRQATHLPQVLTAATITATLGTQTKIPNAPQADSPAKKPPASQLQNALKFIISQNPLSPSKFPDVSGGKNQPPRQQQQNISVPPSTTTEMKMTSKNTVSSAQKPAGSVVATPSESKPSSKGDGKVVKNVPQKTKPASKIETLLCEETLSTSSLESSPVKLPPTTDQEVVTKQQGGEKKDIEKETQDRKTPSVESVVKEKVEPMSDKQDAESPGKEMKMDTLSTRNEESGDGISSSVMSIKSEGTKKTSAEPQVQGEGDKPKKDETSEKTASVVVTTSEPVPPAQPGPPPPAPPIESSVSSPVAVPSSQEQPVKPSTTDVPSPLTSSVPNPSSSTTTITTTTVISQSDTINENRKRPLSLTTVTPPPPSKKQALISPSLSQPLPPLPTVPESPVLPITPTPLPVEIPTTPITPQELSQLDSTDSLIEALCSDPSSLDDSAVSTLASQLGLDNVDSSVINMSEFLNIIQPDTCGVTPTTSDQSTVEDRPVTDPSTSQATVEAKELSETEPHDTPTSKERQISTPDVLDQETKKKAESNSSTQPLSAPLSTNPMETQVEVLSQVRSCDIATTPTFPAHVTPGPNSPTQQSTAPQVTLTEQSEPLRTNTKSLLDFSDIGSLLGSTDDLLDGMPEELAESIQALVKLDEKSSHVTWK